MKKWFALLLALLALACAGCAYTVIETGPAAQVGGPKPTATAAP